MTPSVESLESRAAPGWVGPVLTYSIAPDGTQWSGGTSALVSTMGRKAPSWRDDLRRALEAWGAAVGLMVRQVPDGGQPIGADGQQGQIRIGGVPAEPTVLGWAYYPGAGNRAGDVTFNINQDWAGGFDLYSVALHELGHAVAGLDHGASPVMAPKYQGKLSGLSPSDVAAARSASDVAPTPALVFGKQGRFG